MIIRDYSLPNEGPNSLLTDLRKPIPTEEYIALPEWARSCLYETYTNLNRTTSKNKKICTVIIKKDDIVLGLPFAARHGSGLRKQYYKIMEVFGIDNFLVCKNAPVQEAQFMYSAFIKPQLDNGKQTWGNYSEIKQKKLIEEAEKSLCQVQKQKW